MTTTTAQAHPNIALIKYWGDIDPELHIPVNGSISMNLAELKTTTEVHFDDSFQGDQVWINDLPVQGDRSRRVSEFLEHVRKLAGSSAYALVRSWNNFPMSAGIASSASAFAALSLAATRAAGFNLDEKQLSRLARLGSGSACRSVPGGFVEWKAGSNDEDSFAFSLAEADHWPLYDCITIVSQEEKTNSSSYGHSLAATSLFQGNRIKDAPRRLDICQQALIGRDFEALAEITELDCNMMHAVMLTSCPPLLYWHAATVTIMRAVWEWRREGLPVCYTIDAGPNVHVLTLEEQTENIAQRLKQLPGVVEVLTCHPGGAARYI
jgi:diphosphomevalonate decarboxylase